MKSIYVKSENVKKERLPYPKLVKKYVSPSSDDFYIIFASNKNNGIVVYVSAKNSECTFGKFYCWFGLGFDDHDFIDLDPSKQIILHN